MNRLTIRWDTDAAAEALRRMRTSDAGLGDSLTAARAARQTLDEASPDDASKVLNMLLAEFDATVKSLEDSRRSLETLIGKTDAANRNFENAVSDIDRIIAALGPGTAPEGAGQPAPLVGHGGPAPISWNVYQAIVLPSMRGRMGPLVPDWLEAIMNNADLYQNWM